MTQKPTKDTLTGSSTNVRNVEPKGATISSEDWNHLNATYLLLARHMDNVRRAANNIRIRSSELDDALDRAESSRKQLQRTIRDILNSERK
jgi:hypothetical protein